MKKFRFLQVVVVVLLVVALGALAGCRRRSDESVLVVGATAVPHAEVLEQVVGILAEKGIELVIREFDDFNTPNLALRDGDIDVNYFQHRPFLENFNANNNSNLVPVFGVHFEPFRLYAGRLNTLDVPNGAEIAIPGDATNEDRALRFLESLGLIQLYDVPVGTASATTSVSDNPRNIVFHPVVAQTLPSLLPDVDYAVINGNVALGGGVFHLAIDGALEDPEGPAGHRFTNFLVVRSGYENDSRVQALVEAINTQAIRDFILSRYAERVLPTFIRP
jgi:D-methionine transport system substrate-binding protein